MSMKVGICKVLTDYNSTLVGNCVLFDCISGLLTMNGQTVQGSRQDSVAMHNGYVQMLISPEDGKFEVYNNKSYVGEGTFQDLKDKEAPCFPTAVMEKKDDHVTFLVSEYMHIRPQIQQNDGNDAVGQKLEEDDDMNALVNQLDETVKLLEEESTELKS